MRCSDDNSWTEHHLILHTVDNNNSADLPQTNHQSATVSHGNDGNIVPPPTAAAIISGGLSIVNDLECSTHSRSTSLASIIPVNGITSVASRSTQHFTWPFTPVATFVDQDVCGNLRKTMEDFLATFFRLWEESRLDLRYLYDQSAIFSNLLAKQGCTPRKVTKSTGWPSIYTSIARLPALSNDPIQDLIVDAWPVPTDPPTVLCSVHGSFSEFPKNIKRAFDRTFVLRPVDTHLYPSEGCLGLIKWIILSDTLTIRKHTTRTTAIVDGFKQQNFLEVDRLRHTSCGMEMSDPAFFACRSEPSLDQQQHQCTGYRRREDSPATSPSRRAPTSARVIESDLDSEVPAINEENDFDEDDGPCHSLPTGMMASSPPALSDGIQPISAAVDVTPAGHIAALAAQLREMRGEINRLKHDQQKGSDSPSAVTVPTGDTLPAPQATDSVDVSSSKKRFQISSSYTYLHRGFGVTKKRYLIPTDMDVYLNVSIRGDIVSWHQKDRSQVQLLLSGASPTDIVESACYSAVHKTLIVGSRASSTVRPGAASPLALVKFLDTVECFFSLLLMGVLCIL